MTLKPSTSIIFILLISFVLAISIVLASFSFLLPRALQSTIISEITSATGIADFSVHVREVDLDGADFGDIRVGAEAEPALIVRSIQVDYTPAGLLQKKIKQVTASGIEVYLEFKDGKFGFRGVNLQSLLQRLQSRLGVGPDSSKPETFPTLERLIFRNVTAHIRINSRTYRISAHVDIHPENVAFDRIACTALIYMRGQKMTLSADVDLNHKSNTLKFSAQNVMLARFADFTDQFDDLHVSGRANIDANAILSWEPLRLTKLSSIIEFDEFDMDVHHFQFQNQVNPKNEKLPWRIQLEAINDSELWITASDMAALRPLALNIAQMNFRLKRAAAGLQASGNFSVSPAAADERQPESVPFTIITSVPLNIHTTLRYSKAGNLSYTLKTQQTKTEASTSVRLKSGKYIIKARPPVIDISGNVNQIGAETSYKLNIPDVEIVSDKGTTSKFPAVLLDGTATLDRQSNVGPGLTFNLRLPGSMMRMPAVEFKFPRLTLAGQYAQTKTRKPMLSALLTWEDVSLMFPQKDASITAVRGQIPIRWPLTGKVQKGSFSADRLLYKDTNVGSIHGTIEQTAAGFDFSGEHKNRLTPDLSLGFHGNTIFMQNQKPETRIQFQNLTPATDIQVDLGKLIPRAKGIIVAGRLALEGNLIFSGPGMSGSFKSNLNNGSVTLPQNKISIEGIQMKFSIPELPNLRSAPQQLLRFDRASMGDLEIRKGEIEFQIESSKSVLIEKGQFKWVDGNVDAYAIRISPGIEDYRMILYCDRVNLAKVLRQLGVAKVEADGELNGRIPLRYYNGTLRIDDGFLFSTPGIPRKIRMTDTDLLTAGIAPDSPHYIQMELARKALEDYDYAWVKLNINSEGEDLVIRMQFDGKPAKPLPFVYRADLGQFAKIEAEGKGSIFQGIRLDVNFRLPFNKLLQYREILKMMQ